MKVRPKSAPSQTYGSLQDVYKEKKFSLKTKAPEVWKIPLERHLAKGDNNALVTVVEFSDFECPFCSRGANTLAKLEKQYKGKVRYVFKHFPLSFHQNAHLASQASIEAQRQGKFWEYHDKLFANQRKLKRRDLLRYAREIGLDMKRFEAALKKKTHAAEVDEDMKLGASVGVQGTPTAFVNGRQASALTENDVKTLIDDELERVKEQVKKGLRGDALYNALIEKGKQKDAAPPPRAKEAEEEKPKVIAVGEAPTLGPDDAPVTIVEFSDFECPYCVRGAQAVKKVARAYKNKVRLVFKHYPLSFHFAAKGAAIAAMAAHQQGKFWEFHDMLFAGQKNLSRPSLLSYARALELDMDSFTSALDSTSLKVYVDEDMRQGNNVGVRGTPTFFINGIKLSSGLSFSAFKEAIDPILLKKGFKQSDLPDEPGEEIAIESSPSKGAEQPLATVVEYSDFECPFCSRAASTLSALAADYKKYVKFVFKHYPLSFHKNAHLASQAAIAAQEQGKFWPYHDKLFANQRNLKRPDLERYAQELGLDMDKFKKPLIRESTKLASILRWLQDRAWV
ncbi:MAG: thioredoxin domain-containing protein [Myxococcales bacterium]|nr:thioredoxin domain-containing protein [Myxococcales bacterium]